MDLPSCDSRFRTYCVYAALEPMSHKKTKKKLKTLLLNKTLPQKNVQLENPGLLDNKQGMPCIPNERELMAENDHLCLQRGKKKLKRLLPFCTEEALWVGYLSLTGPQSADPWAAHL